MKSQLDRIIDMISGWLDSVARARAAAELAQLGYHEAANRLINNQEVVDAS